MCLVQRNPTTGPAVLVVDDDPAFCEFMAEALARVSYRVITAENGRRALDLIAGAKFDVIVTDIYMPQADAIDLVRDLRRRCSSTPVVVVTGDQVAHQGPILRFLRHLGVAQILPKPVSPDQLRVAVAAALGGSSVANQT